MRPAFPLAIAAFAVFFGTPQSVSSQQNADPSVTEIVNRAAGKRPLYQEVFRNLLSRETKTFEIYGKNGEVKRTRTVVSTFLVYQLSRDPTRISEFRNIQSVDGKPVENTEGRTENLFATVAKAESSEKELKQIETESQRFDEDISISGQTLFQAVTLTENLSPFFEFTLEGKENIDGETAFVVAYRQIRATPYITADPTRMPADHRLTVFNDAGLKVGMELGERLSGKLWIDTNSFRIRRELRDFTIQPRNASRRGSTSSSSTKRRSRTRHWSPR